MDVREMRYVVYLLGQMEMYIYSTAFIMIIIVLCILLGLVLFKNYFIHIQILQQLFTKLFNVGT